MEGPLPSPPCFLSNKVGFYLLVCFSLPNREVWGFFWIIAFSCLFDLLVPCKMSNALGFIRSVFEEKLLSPHDRSHGMNKWALGS